MTIRRYYIPPQALPVQIGEEDDVLDLVTTSKGTESDDSGGSATEPAYVKAEETGGDDGTFSPWHHSVWDEAW